MTLRSSHFLLSACALTILLAVSLQPASAQSQASNGQIDGAVVAPNGMSVTGVSVTAMNVGTGATRSLITDENGMFRFPLLPLGSYRITTEAPGFRKLVLEGVTVSTGQTASLNLTLEIGDLRESVTVTSDAPLADPGKIELGRVMNSSEVKNLPLITANPYTFVFLQSNVTGNRTALPGLGHPNVNANGFSRRGSYQLDGNYATDVKVGGIRMMFISNTYVREIQLVTNGMSAEFGGTVGHIMNVVTPSGSNSVHGDVVYKFRRAGFAAQRFNVAPGASQHDPVADVLTGSIGGPIVKDRWHYYIGFEAFKWDLASASRTITITEANKQALIFEGVPASIMPASYKAPETFRFLIGRTDIQMNSSNQLGIRFFVTNGASEKIQANRLNTLQLSNDTMIWDTSVSAQLVSKKGDRLFNELRVQRSARDLELRPNEFTGSGPVIRIPGVAVFGAPLGNLNEGQSHLLTVQNHLSYIVGRHSIKFGGGFANHDGIERSNPPNEYVFQDINAYALAIRGVNRRSYSQYTETFGDPTIDTEALFLNAFIQDEWRVSRRLRINTGLRYDLYIPPAADPTAAYLPSRTFRVDKNNLGPRIGISYTVGQDKRPAVIRASAGIYYDPPIINYYVSALRNNGSLGYFTVRFSPATSPVGPKFPGSFGGFPAGQSLPPISIEALDSNFKTMTALHANLQFEKALTGDLSFIVAYSRSSGRHIPISRNTNCLSTGDTLADGRPVYGDISVNASGSVTVSPCTIRKLPQFQNIKVWESVGNLNYNAATFILSKRLSAGYQFSINYTLARSIDDAPEENLGPAATSQSDPSNRRLDRAVSIADQTHTVAATFVARPSFRFRSRGLNYLANHNQLGIIARISDGERYNAVTNIDLNRDGLLSDRPVGIPRNFLKTPGYLNIDVRYSRLVRFNERSGLELFAEIVNVTNTNSIIGFGSTTFTANHATNSVVNPFTGELRRPIPDFAAGEVISTDSRRMQLGVRFYF